MLVEVKYNNIERALKKLKRGLVEDGLFRELQARRAFEKPSQQRRRLHKAAVMRERKRILKREADDRAGLFS